jgi:rhodanese-related sulfurtransferase
LALLGLHRQLPHRLELEVEQFERGNRWIVFGSHFSAKLKREIKRRGLKNMHCKNCFSILVMVAVMAGAGCQAQSGQTDGAASLSVSPETPVEQSVAMVVTIEPSEAAKMISNQADLQILDVRTPEEVAQGVIKGAKVIDWQGKDFAKKTEALDKTKPVLVYCKLGGRSSQAAKVLTEQGFTQVYNLDGGITKWQGEGHPLQK